MRERVGSKGRGRKGGRERGRERERGQEGGNTSDTYNLKLLYHLSVQTTLYTHVDGSSSSESSP